jgi:hypothetical protein
MGLEASVHKQSETAENWFFRWSNPRESLLATTDQLEISQQSRHARTIVFTVSLIVFVIILHYWPTLRCEALARHHGGSRGREYFDGFRHQHRRVLVQYHRVLLYCAQSQECHQIVSPFSAVSSVF